MDKGPRKLAKRILACVSGPNARQSKAVVYGAQYVVRTAMLGDVS